VYNALSSSESISFNLLHKDCSGSIGYLKRCKKCGETVGNDQIVKGYQYEPDKFVIVEKEDLEKVRLKSTRIIEISGFIDASLIDPVMCDAAYFAGPDGAVASAAYGLLSETLQKTGKVGVGKVVIRDREEAVMIGPMGKGLVMYKLRSPGEIRQMAEVPGLDEIGPADAPAVKLAESLVEAMTTELSALDLTDRYAQAVREIINAKIQGKEIVSIVEEEQPSIDIMTALKASIEQAKTQMKPMEQAPGVARKAKKAAPAPVAQEAPAKRGRRRSAG
jgi:DNA end-binding protein Ku